MRILIVDDNAVIADVFSQIFSLLGHEPVISSSGADALTRLGAADAAFDVVFSDISMPDMDGHELGRRVTHLRRNNHLKLKALVAMSGYGDPEDTARSLACGFDRHIVKPPELEDLEKLLIELDQAS